MPPRKQWDDEEEESSSAPSSPAVAPVVPVRRGKFDDEEDQDNEVLDSWDVDSDVEREKAKKEEEAKARAAAAAAKPKKSKAERIAEHKADRARREADGSDSSDSESEAQKRARLRRTEKESDLRHAEDLFADAGGVPATRKGTTAGTAVVVDAKDPTTTVDMTKMPLFNPVTKTQFETVRTTLGGVMADWHKKPHYTLFLQEFSKMLAKDLPSDQIKKVASSLTTLSNEKMKEEKAADRGGKKSKAQKTKTSLVTNRANAIETNNYDDGDFGDDDFM